MKIFNIIPNMGKVYSQKKVNKNKMGTKKYIQGKDNVSLSNKARSYQIAMKALKNIPDVREEKVRELKERIKSSEYDVTGEKLAEKLVDRFIDKKV